MPIPPDNRTRGDTGHIADHNNIADELTSLTGAVADEAARAEAAEAAAAQRAANLTDLADPAAARAALGLGSAATQAAVAFDPAGAAAAETSRAEAAEGTLTSGVAANASAITTETTRAQAAEAAETARAEAAEAGLLSSSLLPLPVADGGTGAGSAGGARTNLGLGTAATQASAAFDAAGTSAAEASRATAAEAAITASIPTSLPPNGAAGGALTGTFPNPGLATVTIAEGGTGQATRQAALDALTGTQSAGTYARSDGTHTTLAAIQAGDVPALNQNTTGTAGGLSATLPVASGGTGQTSAPAALNALGGVAAAGDIGGTSASPQVTATHLASPLPVAQGGTGQATQAAALTALAGTQSAGKVLRSDGTSTALASLQAGDVPTLNQSTTGTAAGLSATLAVGSGGTGQTTQQAAIDALTGTQSSGKVLRSDGTHATLASLATGDVPTLNQDTTGKAAKADALNSATTVVNVASAAAPSSGQVLTATDSTHATWQTVIASWHAGLFGDGSDGAVTLDGTVTVAWASKAGSVYTLSRNVMLSGLTINSGVTLNTHGYLIFCTGNPANAGTIAATGSNGFTGGGPSGAQSGALAAGGAGATSTTGAGAQAPSVSGAVATGSGGAGGAGTSGAGGASRTPGITTPVLFRIPFAVLAGFANAATGAAPVIPSGAPGGSSGAGDGTNLGGAGGGGGGIIVIFAPAFTNTGTITAAGANGGTPLAGNCGGGGGAGGGNILIYTLTAWTNSGTATVAGGTHGTATGTGVNGSDGSAGTVLNVVLV